MGSLRIIWMNCGLSLIHEPRVLQSLRTVKCTVSFIGKPEKEPGINAACSLMF